MELGVCVCVCVCVHIRRRRSKSEKIERSLAYERTLSSFFIWLFVRSKSYERAIGHLPSVFVHQTS